MYYEINVSRAGRHFFATCERSITDKAKLREVLSEIASRFTGKDGYQIDVSERQLSGSYLSHDDLKEIGLTIPNLGGPK